MNKFLDKMGLWEFLNSLTAKWIKYDNTASGLSSTTVQGAVDEVMSNVDKKISVEDRIAVNPWWSDSEYKVPAIRGDGVTSAGQYIDMYHSSNESNSASVRLEVTSDETLRLNRDFQPAADSIRSIGSASRRWVHGYYNNLYSTTGGVSVTSDERLKDMWAYSEAYDELLDMFIPKAFTYKEGTSGRTHLGFSAQQLEEAVLSKGLTLKDFACITYDEPYTDEDGVEHEGVYSIRPMEMIAMLVNRVQKQKNEYKDLLGRVEKLEGEKNE